MAEFDYSRPAVQAALRQGRNPTDALRIFRANGGRVRTQDWYRQVGQAVREKVMDTYELASHPSRIPTAGEIQTMTVPRRGGGYLQRALVVGTTPEGLTITKQVSFRFNRLRSRRYVMEQAKLLLQQHGGRFQQAPDSIPIDVLGAVYQGTYQLVTA